jgi:two-component system response regulator QseB
MLRAVRSLRIFAPRRKDERSVAFSISFALKADGHTVEIVSDGEQALAELKAKPTAFDRVITDHGMPRMNGVELVKRIRDTAFPGEIVVISAHLPAENRGAYVALGVDLMIPKRFDVHEVRAAIVRIASGEQRTAEPGNVQLSAPETLRLLRLALPGKEYADEDTAS